MNGTGTSAVFQSMREGTDERAVGRRIGAAGSDVSIRLASQSSVTVLDISGVPTRRHPADRMHDGGDGNGSDHARCRWWSP
eukprot:6321683-Prymnesium_polylepis.1